MSTSPAIARRSVLLPLLLDLERNVVDDRDGPIPLGDLIEGDRHEFPPAAACGAGRSYRLARSGSAVSISVVTSR